FDLELRRSLTAQNAAVQFKAFRATNRRIVSLDDRWWRKFATCVRLVGRLETCATFGKIDNRVRDQIFSHVHRQRERLQREIIAVPIDNYPWKSVAVAPDDTAKLLIHASPHTVFRCLRNSSFEEIQVKFLFPSRETASHNLRLRIINRAPDQMIFAR